jgi:hypothetical protein
VKARITVTLKTASADEAQASLMRCLCTLVSEGVVSDFHFEIDAGEGIVTEKCILSSGRAVA